MNIVETAIVRVFPGININKINMEQPLGTLPGWDSMNAINLQIEIESLSGKSNLGLFLTDAMTVKNIIEELSFRKIIVNTEKKSND